jgi:hypothetical protein
VLSADLTNFRKLRGSFGRHCVVNEIYTISKDFELDDDKRIWEQERITESPQGSIPIVNL